MGARMRPDGNCSGWVRVNQPMREKYSSSACSIRRLAMPALGPSPCGAFEKYSGGARLAGAVEPADQKVAVGQLHEGRGWVVPFSQRKNQLTAVRGGASGEK